MALTVMAAPDGAGHCCEGWICEAHPNLPWPHDECLGQGMRCINETASVVEGTDARGARHVRLEGCHELARSPTEATDSLTARVHDFLARRAGLRSPALTEPLRAHLRFLADHERRLASISGRAPRPSRPEYGDAVCPSLAGVLSAEVGLLDVLQARRNFCGITGSVGLVRKCGGSNPPLTRNDSCRCTGYVLRISFAWDVTYYELLTTVCREPARFLCGMK
jgi:hypothetical protein